MEAADSSSTITDGGDRGTPSPSSMAANAPPPFLVKTYDMVEDPSTDKVVSWSPTNNSFVVWDSAEFAKELLPKYFKHNNFSSFVRQLSTYTMPLLDFGEEGTLKCFFRLQNEDARQKFRER